MSSLSNSIPVLVSVLSLGPITSANKLQLSGFRRFTCAEISAQCASYQRSKAILLSE